MVGFADGGDGGAEAEDHEAGVDVGEGLGVDPFVVYVVDFEGAVFGDAGRVC